MARWKLMTAHYLKVPGEEWEYQEQDRRTGRPNRVKMPVPRHLDPQDPSCWTNKWGTKDDAEGEVIVCHEGKGEKTDHVFFGDPTPDMMPVDDEAREISAKFTERWSYKPETAPVSYSQSLVDKFQQEKAAIEAKPQQIEIPGLADLTTAMGAMVKQNQELMAQAQANRRV